MSWTIGYNCLIICYIILCFEDQNVVILTPHRIVINFIVILYWVDKAPF
jgi:hypothetical protein